MLHVALLCQAHVFDATFGMKNRLRGASSRRHISMQIDLFGERRSGHYVSGGAVFKRADYAVMCNANCRKEMLIFIASADEVRVSQCFKAGFATESEISLQQGNCTPTHQRIRPPPISQTFCYSGTYYQLN